MTAPAGRADTERFRDAIAEHLGLQFDDARLDQLAEVLARRVAKTAGPQPASYLARLLSRARWPEELRALAEELTVPETYFFRGLDHLDAFADVVLGDWTRDRDARTPLRILSAGCASGEEAYSLAILVRERLGEPTARATQIVGIDVNPVVLAKANAARYSEWSLRQTPDDVRARYFQGGRGDLVLDARIRAMVSFEERNLLDDDPAFWAPQAFDVIFCRNVLMYFRPDVVRMVVARLAASLRPGGYLFLGHAETLRGISQAFHLRHTHETFYYQRRAGTAEAALAAPSSASPPPRASDPTPAPLEIGDAWMHAIHGASERIAALARRTAAGPATQHPAAGRAAGPPWDLALPVELLRRERFGDAIAVLHGLPPESADDPDVQLLRAVLLMNRGELGEARRLCAHLLERDALNAGAHYLMALCLEHAGESAAAVEHDRTAVYLDAAFAMPHLHLGLAARRAGDLQAARRELAQALTLLDREDSSRVLLFGGGFTREALVELCRGELRRCGVAA